MARRATVEAPPPTFRGIPRVIRDACCGEAACAVACPARAISIAPSGGGGWTWTLDRAACLGCGRCFEACPHEALDAESIGDLGTELRELAARRFGRSLQLRHLDVGSCNGCDWELNALLNPVYDFQRFGGDVVASPRRADGLLVTGPVTRHLEPALWATYEAVPEPKLVIAVGACAREAGFLRGSYAVAGGVDRRLPVAVYIPGCPPRPEAILHGLLLAIGRRGAPPRGR